MSAADEILWHLADVAGATVAEMATERDVSPITVGKATRQLEEEGLIVRVGESDTNHPSGGCRPVIWSLPSRMAEAMALTRETLDSRVLAVLGSERAMTTREIAVECRAGRSSVSYALVRLKRAGLVEGRMMAGQRARVWVRIDEHADEVGCAPRPPQGGARRGGRGRRADRPRAHREDTGDGLSVPDPGSGERASGRGR